LPQVGGNARKANYDYSEGRTDELIDIIIEEGASFFVCALGIPPRAMVDKLHNAGVSSYLLAAWTTNLNKTMTDIGCK